MVLRLLGTIRRVPDDVVFPASPPVTRGGPTCGAFLTGEEDRGRFGRRRGEKSLSSISPKTDFLVRSSTFDMLGKKNTSPVTQHITASLLERTSLRTTEQRVFGRPVAIIGPVLGVGWWADGNVKLT